MTGRLPLLFEIGCEEIPARFLEKAQADLGLALAQSLQAARLLPESPGKIVETFSTPRRLVAHAEEILATQPERLEEISGPPVSAAFDKEGKPTRAAIGFAEKHQVAVEDLARISTPKGEYLAARKTHPGRPAREVLGEILPGVIGSLDFQKSMYWTAKTGPRFVRPIRWILALLGEGESAEIISFELAGLTASGKTYGHRLKGRRAIPVRGFKDYLNKLRRRWVEVDPARRRRFAAAADQLLIGAGSVRVQDGELESWVVNSTEWPVPIVGQFAQRHLALPREVLITVMRGHQKYFAAEDESGNLRPHFVTILNVPGDPDGLIRQGHERVLSARFADANFFWNADQKVSIEDRIPQLQGVTYHEKLGSYADKIARAANIARNISLQIEAAGQMTAEEGEFALRAIALCKCDLTTQMVREFPELQGVIGGLYAAAQGEAPEIAHAIYDHYRPAHAEDACPRSIIGSVVSIADKLDSIMAGFAAGLAPSGSSDPFGLRRAGNGIIKVSVEALPGLNLGAAIQANVTPAVSELPRRDLETSLSEFFRERLQFYLERVSEIRADTARAVLNSAEGWAVPSQAVERAKALEAVRHSEDFEALSAAAKRTRNILRRSEIPGEDGLRAIKPELLGAGPERELYEGYLEMREQLSRYEGDYKTAFRRLASLRPKVDAFFDKVLVMDPDERVRTNRLILLNRLNETVFLKLADLSEMEADPLVNAGR